MNDLFTPKGTMLEECDLPRIDTNARRVWDHMLSNSHPDGWVNLIHAARQLMLPHSSVTACVRGFRNPENGEHTVEVVRASKGHGTFLYRLKPNTPEGVKKAKEKAKAKPATVTDELLTLKAWIDAQLQFGGWPESPFTRRIVDKIDKMVKERPE